MTIASLLTFLVALVAHVDGHGHAIPRPYGAVTTIAAAALETDNPKLYAVWLDVLAAHESGYRTGVTGDSGKSCGAWQTPCGRTPPDGLGQARLAIKILKQAITTCWEHPLWAYASGRCVSSPVALRYERETRAAMAVELVP